jgi:uncharacterized protein (DUF1501 family)
MRYNRRHFLQGAGGAALGAASLGGVTSALTGFQARAADTSGYKALVCLFLFGGLDCHDTVLPYDTTSYDEYAAIRAPLLNLYSGGGGTSSRDRSELLALTPDNAADFGGREFALPPQFSGLHGLFQSGDAAIVGNVGPLIFPLNRAQWEAESVETPKRLFSHNDQQSTWMSSEPEGAAFGWGGRFADATSVGVTGSSRSFSTISMFSNELFLTGETIRPYQAAVFGPAGIETIGFYSGEPAVQAALENHFGAVNFNGTNFIESDVAAAIGASFETNETFNAAIGGAVTLTTPFPSGFLGAQLQTVAQSIAARSILGVSRQIYFVGFGGFDTHSAQAQDLPTLQSEIDAAVVAFHTAMQELGVGNDVTLFTASDFGRTLAINGDGTDHGWGAHHFVVGGAVQGRNIYGGLPEATFDHDQDAGGGRLIPTTSVEQFAEPLGRWFGLNDSEINASLPNLSNFAPLPTPFV